MYRLQGSWSLVLLCNVSIVYDCNVFCSVLHCSDLKIAQLHLVMLNSMIHVPVQLNLLCGLQIFVPS